MFTNASNFVHGVDKAFVFIIGISVFFLVLLTTIMIVFVIKYNRKKNPKAVQVKDSSLLEITWTTIPLILVLLMFYYGWQGFLPMRQVPDDAMKIKAIGQMWKWTFEYPGNKQSDTLLLPINKAVKVDLVSKDVLHGFSIPGFRVKEDAVPGKNNYTWFIPSKLGDYDLYCTVYCGLSHSYMYALVRVVPEIEYNKWVAGLPVKKNEDNNEGYKILEKTGCFACHTINGNKSVGPSFKGLFGSSHEVISNGKSRKITADELYIESSILDPDKDIVVGFPQGVMKSYKGIIKEKDFPKINAYLKTLKAE
jgi:cytochrome c oxidase subunit 2